MELGAGVPEGPAALADAVGVARLVDHLDERHAETGASRYEVVDSLRTVADAGGFYESEEQTAESYETIRLEAEGRVWELVFDRPDQLNSLDAAFLEEFDDALSEAESDDEARVLLVSGAGDRAFSTGADVQQAAAELDSLGAMELAREGQRVFGRLEASSLVVVAVIDGYCLGGGMELAACADLRIASTRSSFGQPEHRLGLMPGWGGTQRLPHLVGEARAKEIILTAERFDAETMADYGFLMDVVEAEELDERARELATDLASGPPVAHALTKRAILRGRDDTEAGLELEAQSFGHVFGTDDLREGVAAFDADRSPEFTGE
jgi:enoyl-CoA hydratase/3-hydroxyacyl-CoA dehydrogenase